MNTIMSDDVFRWHYEGRGTKQLSCLVWEEDGQRWYGGLIARKQKVRRRPGMLYRVNVRMKDPASVGALQNTVGTDMIDKSNGRGNA